MALINTNAIKTLLGEGYNRLKSQPYLSYALPFYGLKEKARQAGELLQKFPDTTITLPERETTTSNYPLKSMFESQDKYARASLKLLTGLPGSMIKGYGETLSKWGTGKKLGVFDYLNMTDFVPGMGFISAGTRKVAGELGEKAVKEIGEEVFEKAVTKKALGGKSVLEDIYRGFEVGRTEGKVGVGKKVAEYVNRSQLLDRLTPVYEFVKNAPSELTAEVNPYKRMRLLAGISGKVEALIKTGLGPTLKNNIKNLDDLSALLTLEREDELIRRGFTRARTAEDIAQGVTELQGKYGAEGFAALKKSADEVVHFGSKLLDELKDSGVISGEAFDAIRANNEHYIPFEVVDHLADNLGKGISSSYNVAKQSVVKAIGSSEKAISDPLESLLRKTSNVIGLTERNRAMKSLVNLRKIDPYFEDFIKPVKGAIEKGFDTINLFEDGKNVAYQVPEEIAAAIKNLDVQSAHLAVKILAPQAKLLRAGATGLNIGFIPANILRDVSDAIFTEASESGIKGAAQLILNYPKAILTAARKGDLYYQWLMSGGAQSTLTEQVFRKGPQALAEVAGKKPIIKTVLSLPKDLVLFANRVGEQSTRIAEFSKSLKEGKGAAGAAFKSRDITLDFAKSGNSIKTLNQIIPFLNAGIQGAEKLFRVFKNNPVKATMYSSLLFGVPTIMLYRHNSQFKDYADIPVAEKNSNWILLARDRSPEEVAAGEGPVGIKIPKGFLGRPVSAITESVLEFIKNQDFGTFIDFMKTSGEQLSPVGLPTDIESLGRSTSGVIPPGFKAVIEWLTNKNLYFGNDIVPQNLQKVEPSQQFKPSTSGVAKALGELLDVSPLKLENTIYSTTGGLGKQLLDLFSGDIKKATVGQVIKRFNDIRSGASVDDEYNEVSKYATKAATESLQRKREAEKLNEELKGLPKDEANRRANELKKTNPLLYSKLKEVAEDDKKDLTSLERYIKTLPVEDGSRANYLTKKLNELDNNEERKTLIKLWVFKGIISEKVYQQLLQKKASGELVSD